MAQSMMTYPSAMREMARRLPPMRRMSGTRSTRCKLPRRTSPASAGAAVLRFASYDTMGEMHAAFTEIVNMIEEVSLRLSANADRYELQEHESQRILQG
jgi:hypothetical protein